MRENAEIARQGCDGGEHGLRNEGAGVAAAVEPVPAWGELFAGRNAVYSLALGGSVMLHAINIYIATTIMPSSICPTCGDASR